MDASCLPANFASTAPALQRLAFHAKDTLMVVDDVAPPGEIATDNCKASLNRYSAPPAINKDGAG
jgi:hypothetical protein